MSLREVGPSEEDMLRARAHKHWDSGIDLIGGGHLRWNVDASGEVRLILSYEAGEIGQTTVIRVPRGLLLEFLAGGRLAHRKATENRGDAA